MKKLFVFLSVIFLFSCGNKQDVISSEEIKAIEDFMIDERLPFLVANLNTIISQPPNSKDFDNEQVLAAWDGLKQISLELIKEYGEENIFEYCDILSDKNPDISNVKSGDCCHRNPNGTVNGDCCNWWGHVVVSVATAVHCDQPSGGASSAEIDAFYDCVQERFCNNC
ncbi:MAG: hypothetical protein PHF92_10890 [Bacteroidales bacterium]|nr:hypothetical protein [Bacteroidales bacterium]